MSLTFHSCHYYHQSIPKRCNYTREAPSQSFYQPAYVIQKICKARQKTGSTLKLLWLVMLYPDSKVHGAYMGRSGADRTQVGLVLAPLTLLSGYIDGLVQKRCNSSALAKGLCISCTNPSIWQHISGSTSVPECDFLVSAQVSILYNELN